MVRIRTLRSAAGTLPHRRVEWRAGRSILGNTAQNVAPLPGAESARTLPPLTNHGESTGASVALPFSRMLYLTHVPAPPLRDCIEYLWLLSDAPSHGKELIVPSGTLELAINLHEDEIRVYEPRSSNQFRRFSGMVFSGAYGRPFGIDTREHTLMMGVHFRPGGAFPFLRINAGDLVDAHIDADAVWGRRAPLLRERLCSARSHAERFTVLEDALRAGRATDNRLEVRFAIDKFMNGGIDVGDVVSELGLSHRRFVEVFTREVGMTPKLFCRVLRFQRILTAAQTSPSPEWARLGAAAGYFDQPHLIRDFSAFCGMPPTQYLRSRIEAVKENHVALL